MTLNFKDFAPKEVPNLVTVGSDIAPVTDALLQANAWIATREQVEVINVETVVLPNMHDDTEQGTVDGSLPMADSARTTWHQFIRVWYREA